LPQYVCTWKYKTLHNNNNNNYVTLNNNNNNNNDLQATITGKQCKYQELVLAIKQHWQLNKIIVLSAMGVNPNMLNHIPTNPNLPPRLLSQVQKVVILNTCSIVRKFHNDEVHLPDKEANKPKSS
jgi:hypothetical protein